jgi:[CysO sulfur-carrier protein]-S-L-cysteine hydrolase
MTIILPKKISKILHKQIHRHSPNETKGALFAKQIDDDHYEIDEVYLERQIGSIAFVRLYNNQRYKRFQKQYHAKHDDDFLHHNYIGDWHSHPSFECVPSSFDRMEVEMDLQQSNANFLIQVILKVEYNKLVGDAFLYNKDASAQQIQLDIRQ